MNVLDEITAVQERNQASDAEVARLTGQTSRRLVEDCSRPDLDNLPRRKRQRRRTVTDRVLRETSQKASELAEWWGCTKVELYRWLVELAEPFDTPEALAEALGGQEETE